MVTAVPGIGRQDGIRRPEYGPGYADLACDPCGATWVGLPGDPCGWCNMAEERQRQWQAQMILTPELPDPESIEFEDAARAWGKRLGRALRAELVTEPKARAAWRRVTGHD